MIAAACVRRSAPIQATSFEIRLDPWTSMEIQRDLSISGDGSARRFARDERFRRQLTESTVRRESVRVIEDPPICVFPATEARDCASELSDSGDNRPELATLRSPQASTMRQPRSQSVEIATPRSAGDGGEEDDHRRGRGARERDCVGSRERWR
ncbi:hypothetical protein TIFTF001_018928 [Ficus carica]|uniref:Uncharacterized protein n=1 Tax=Ficus carica TaxID=3494 RepID=A0AA88D9P6_FICCA|nr:hypothetical protein TIFTF001_018928 [Ficus carica]